MQRMRQISIALCLFVLCQLGWANFDDPSPQGFHWYTSPTHASYKIKRVAPTQSATLSPTQQLHLLTQHTRDALSTALLHPSEANTTRYMRAQQFWAKQDQRFVRAWQQALLAHPELDYSLHFPTNNNAIALRNDERKGLVNRTVSQMAGHFGLLFFYRGHSSVCQKFAAMLLPFVQANHFSMISITTDHQPIIGLPNPKDIAMANIGPVLDLRARYLPALYLVNLQTHQMKALSFGMIALSDLKTRFLDVATDFKRFSFNGLGETR